MINGCVEHARRTHPDMSVACLKSRCILDGMFLNDMLLKVFQVANDE